MTQLKDSMTNIDKIRQEIERRIKLYSITNEKEQWIVNTYWSVLSFIDSLPEEKPSEGLEEAAEKYADKHGFRVPYDGSNNYYDDVDVKASKDGFIAGAEWQKKQLVSKYEQLCLDIAVDNYNSGKKTMREQMMKGAADGEIVKDISNMLAVTAKNVNLDGLKFGDKVKIIIVKDND